MKPIKIKYVIDSPSMSDEEFEDQEEKVFEITYSMIEDLIREHTNIRNDDSIPFDCITIST